MPPPRVCSAHLEKERTAKENPASWFSYRRKLKNAEHLLEHSGLRPGTSYKSEGLSTALPARACHQDLPADIAGAPARLRGEGRGRPCQADVPWAELRSPSQPCWPGGMWSRLWATSRVLRKKPCSHPEQGRQGSPSTLAACRPGPLEREMPILDPPIWAGLRLDPKPSLVPRGRASNPHNAEGWGCRMHPGSSPRAGTAQIHHRVLAAADTSPGTQ